MDFKVQLFAILVFQEAKHLPLTVLAETLLYDLSFCLEGAQVRKSFLLLIDKQ